jgi:transposase-like protein
VDGTDSHGTPDPQVTPRSTGPRRYSAEYKARILAECETLDKHGKGALLRREGLYSSLITTWRQQRDTGARAALAAPAGWSKADPKDKELEGGLTTEAEVHALDRALVAISVNPDIGDPVPGS